MTRRRVFVAGVGAVTSFADNWPESAAALWQGRTAIRPVEHFDVEGFPCRVAAAVLSCSTSPTNGDRRLGMALQAANQAWSMAHVSAPGDRIGVFIGAESGRASLAAVRDLTRAAGGGASFDHELFGENARALTSEIDAARVSPAAVASTLAGTLGAQGPVLTLSVACASGAAAIVEAARAIELGVCDLALAGGVGADVEPLMLIGFGKLGALSERGVCCPFDVRRDGFVVGEGAAMLVLSHKAHALGVELSGYARSLDAYHLTQPEPNGDGARRAMLGALEKAQRTRVDYIQAHGTSTPLNDEVEASAIRQVFGDQTDTLPVSSVKGALGHWVAGAGALGLLCAIEAVTSGRVFPSVGLCEPDPRCRLAHVTKGSTLHVDSALSNAFAFGGVNASLVVERVSSRGQGAR